MGLSFFSKTARVSDRMCFDQTPPKTPPERPMNPSQHIQHTPTRPHTHLYELHCKLSIVFCIILLFSENNPFPFGVTDFKCLRP